MVKGIRGLPRLGGSQAASVSSPQRLTARCFQKIIQFGLICWVISAHQKKEGLHHTGEKKEKKEKATFTRQMWKMLFNPKVILSPPQKGWTWTLVTSPITEVFHPGSVRLLHGAIQSTIWIPPPRLMFRENEKSIPYKQQLPENFLEGWSYKIRGRATTRTVHHLYVAQTDGKPQPHL